MKALVPAFLLILTLPACVAGGGGVMQETTRMLARSAVDTATGRYLPGVPVKPYTDCVINNAQTGELIQLAQTSAAGEAAAIAQGAWPIVQTVASRAETQQCLLTAVSSPGLLTSGLTGVRG